jgi:hypothetical protein
MVKQTFKPRMGRQNNGVVFSFAPFRGWIYRLALPTVAPWVTTVRCSAAKIDFENTP